MNRDYLSDLKNQNKCNSNSQNASLIYKRIIEDELDFVAFFDRASEAKRS